MVQNPYLLLALGLACLVAAWGGYRHGRTTADDACAARAAQAAHAAASREARLRGQLNALRHAPRHDCAIPADRLRDYAASIRAANQLDAPERVPVALPAPPHADELAVTIWTLDLIDAAAECRRMHNTCRQAKD